MAALYGIMGMGDVKNMSVTQIGQRIVFDAVNQLVDRYNAELAEIERFFVAGETTEPQVTYIMPGGGMMQESTDMSRPGAVRPPLGWPVGFEIRDARDQVAWDDVALAYATVEQVQATVNNVQIRHTNWVRFHLMRALFNNTTRTFVDPLFGNVTVYPLASGDATVYPPVIAATVGATDNHYLAFNQASISDANNPFPTWRAELEEHGIAGDIVALANPTQVAQIKAMTNFVDVADTALRVNQGVEAVYSGRPVPGTIVGYVDGVWISEWRWMPAGYIYMTATEAPAPLMRRVDRAAIPGRGELRLIATQTEFPFIESFWRDRHGYGVANRLNGLVGQITGATYVIPSGYA
jgi:hypothetical protein